MVTRILLYPLWLRIWHLVNALLFAILIITGISMQYSLFGISFNVAVLAHNVCGVLLAMSYFVFIIGNIISGNLAYYRIKMKGFAQQIISQIRYYAIGMFNHQSPPFPITINEKFNPLQKISYVLVMYVVIPAIIASGFAMLFPQVLFTKIAGVPGIVIADLVHVSAGFIGSIFLLVHVYFCTIGLSVSSNFKSITSGYHEME
jgi:thiosulfate reductase cytochrome b subunit